MPHRTASFSSIFLELRGLPSEAFQKMEPDCLRTRMAILATSKGANFCKKSDLAELKTCLAGWLEIAQQVKFWSLII